IVIFMFLGSMRATMIPAVAIPVSIIGTFTVTYALGFSLNILTLLALVLAIGLVVDDAIVMLENVHRHMEMGNARLLATLDSAQEIGFAIVATTITLVAVFVPVAFLQGRVGRLFNEFGLSVAVAVLISGFVALTLTPMLCSRVLRRHMVHGEGDEGSGPAQAGVSGAQVESGGWRGLFDRAFARLLRAYDRTLRYAMHHRRLVMLATLGVILSVGALFFLLPSELSPTEDRGLIFNIVFAPEGATLDYTDRYMRQAEAVYSSVPEKTRMFTAVGLSGSGGGRVTDGFIFVGLKPRGERHRSQQQIV